MVFDKKFVWPPVHGVWRFQKSLYTDQNPKSSKVGGVTYQNLCEKGTKPMEKESIQSYLPFRRKFPKTTQKCIFFMYFWVVSLDFVSILLLKPHNIMEKGKPGRTWLSQWVTPSGWCTKSKCSIFVFVFGLCLWKMDWHSFAKKTGPNMQTRSLGGGKEVFGLA